MIAATSNSLGQAIAQALGLPTDNLLAFTLRFKAGEIVRCDAEYLVTSASGDAMTHIIGKSCQLMELQ
jgi:hypothetical protein